jgi:hypothetical protein
VDGAGICELPDETSCADGGACTPPLVCAPDLACRNVCTKAQECVPGQKCVDLYCADPSEIGPDGHIRNSPSKPDASVPDHHPDGSVPNHHPDASVAVDSGTNPDAGGHDSGTVTESKDASLDQHVSTVTDAATLVDARVSVDAAETGPHLTYPQEVIADSPLSYYRLGEASGTTAVDSMGATNATYSGSVALGAPGAISGDSDTGVALDGTTAYLSLGTGFAFAGTAAMSFEVWFKPAAIGGGYARLLSKEANTGTRQGYLITVTSGGTSFERWRDGSTGGNFASPLTVGAYNHVVATFDGTQMILYINGVPTAPAASPQSLSTSTEGCSVGGYSTPFPGDFVQGTIDEVAFYDHALSPARVLAHYAAATKP